MWGWGLQSVGRDVGKTLGRASSPTSKEGGGKKEKNRDTKKDWPQWWWRANGGSIPPSVAPTWKTGLIYFRHLGTGSLHATSWSGHWKWGPAKRAKLLLTEKEWKIKSFPPLLSLSLVLCQALLSAFVGTPGSPYSASRRKSKGPSSRRPQKVERFMNMGTLIELRKSCEWRHVSLYIWSGVGT